MDQIAADVNLLWKLATGIGGGLSIAFLALWRGMADKSKLLETSLKDQATNARSDCEKERKTWEDERQRLLKERDQERVRADAIQTQLDKAERDLLEESRARVAEQALFLRALDLERSRKSAPPKP